MLFIIAAANIHQLLRDVDLKLHQRVFVTYKSMSWLLLGAIHAVALSGE